jgi:hypothetical protein
MKNLGSASGREREREKGGGEGRSKPSHRHPCPQPGSRRRAPAVTGDGRLEKGLRGGVYVATRVTQERPRVLPCSPFFAEILAFYLVLHFLPIDDERFKKMHEDKVGTYQLVQSLLGIRRE